MSLRREKQRHTAAAASFSSSGAPAAPTPSTRDSHESKPRVDVSVNGPAGNQRDVHDRPALASPALASHLEALPRVRGGTGTVADATASDNSGDAEYRSLRRSVDIANGSGARYADVPWTKATAAPAVETPSDDGEPGCGRRTRLWPAARVGLGLHGSWAPDRQLPRCRPLSARRCRGIARRCHGGIHTHAATPY